MFYFHQRGIAKNLLKDTPIQTVHVRAFLLQKDKDIYPVTEGLNDFTYLGLSDTEGVFAYIRSLDNVKYSIEGAVGANYQYQKTENFRLVVCGLGANLNTEGLIFKTLLAFKKLPIVLSAVIQDRIKLLSYEQPSYKTPFRQGDVYFAIDFTAHGSFSLDDCVSEINCIQEKNTFKLSDFTT